MWRSQMMPPGEPRQLSTSQHIEQLFLATVTLTIPQTKVHLCGFCVTSLRNNCWYEYAKNVTTTPAVGKQWLLKYDVKLSITEAPLHCPFKWISLFVNLCLIDYCWLVLYSAFVMTVFLSVCNDIDKCQDQFTLRDSSAHICALWLNCTVEIIV